MTGRIIATALLFATLGSISSCKKKDDPTPTTPTVDTGTVYMEYFTTVGGSTLYLGNENYINAHGDTFTVSKFNYYISNVVLNGADGTPSYTEPESYHLIEHTANPADMAFKLPKVPGGKYSSVTFTIGVDSLRNVSGAQTGALDPALGNFWSWNTGYIMLKFEGNSSSAPTTGGQLVFHAGGFSGANNVLRTITLPMPEAVTVDKVSTPHIHFTADVLKLFKSPNVIDFATLNTIHMPGANAKKLADNYANMFTITYAGL